VIGEGKKMHVPKDCKIADIARCFAEQNVGLWYDVFFQSQASGESKRMRVDSKETPSTVSLY